MDSHQQPGALDALIQDGLAMQGMAQDLEQLVQEGVQDVIDNHFNDVPLASLGDAPPPLDHQTGGAVDGTGADLASTMRETNGSGAPARPRRRAAAAAANFATDAEGSDFDDSLDEGGDDGDAATGSSGRPEGRATKRRRGGANDNREKKQNMKGRFSGRLPTKEDERRLADECMLMGPLLTKDGELSTLPNIIRAMAKGTVRAHLESQTAVRKEAIAKLAQLQAAPGTNIQTMQSLTAENLALKAELSRAQSQIATLERQNEHQQHQQQIIQEERQYHEQEHIQEQLQQQLQQQQQQLQTMGSLPAGTAIAAGQMAVPVQAVAAPAAPQQVVISTAPNGGLATAQVVQVPAGTALQTGQVVQVAASDPQATTLVAAQPMVVTAVQPAVASGSMLRVASSAQLVAQAAPTPLPPAVTVVAAPAPAPAPASAAAPGEDGDPAAAAAGVAATNLNEHAQQLAVTASLHGAAKTEAAVQAQQLAVQAQQHAQASVQAAQQAEELKKTLSVLPDSEQVQQAAATVQNLEARAQAHASITSQVVAQARGMHEKAQAHEKEQLKAITQATVLQAHAQSLHASAAQLEAHVTGNGPAGSGAAGGGADVPAPTTTVAAVTAPLPSLQPVTAVVQPVSTGMPSGSNGAGPLTSADVGPHAQDGTFSVTPHSTASGGNMFATIAASAAAPTQTAPITVMPSQQLPVPQQVQLMVPQPAVVPQAAMMQLSTVQADATALMQQASAAAQQQASLFHQPSGDQAVDAAAAGMQQQIVVLQQQPQQAQQQVQMVTTVPSQVGAIRPPVTVQILPQTAAAPAAMHRSQSHNVLPLVHAGSNSITTLDASTAAGLAAAADVAAAAASAAINAPVQLAPPATGGSSTPLEVHGSMDGLQQLIGDPTPSQIAADMGPVISIPEQPEQPVVTSTQ